MYFLFQHRPSFLQFYLLLLFGQWKSTLQKCANACFYPLVKNDQRRSTLQHWFLFALPNFPVIGSFPSHHRNPRRSPTNPLFTTFSSPKWRDFDPLESRQFWCWECCTVHVWQWVRSAGQFTSCLQSHWSVVRDYSTLCTENVNSSQKQHRYVLRRSVFVGAVLWEKCLKNLNHFWQTFSLAMNTSDNFLRLLHVRTEKA